MNSFSPSPARYASVAIFLHWVLAALLLFQLSLGWRLETLAGLPQFAAYQLHKTIGFSILLLSLARLLVRLTVRRPVPVRARWPLNLVAAAVHALLYVVMIGGPITGWMLVSTAKVKVPTMFFGMIHWPHLPLAAGWHEPAEKAHGLLGFLLVMLVVLHVAGALWHHIQRDDVLARMLPRAVRSRGALSMAAVLAVLGGIGMMAAAKLVSFAPATATSPAPVADPEPANAAVNEAANAAAPVENAAVANAATNAAAEEGEPVAPWRVDAGSTLAFVADYSGAAVNGSFAKWDADIRFSPDDLDHSQISVSVDLASVDTADGTRDESLRGDSFFDVAAHPSATFRSGRITHRGGNRYRAQGTLSLHGVRKPVTLDFTLDIAGDKATVSGTAPLSRTAYGVGTGEWADTGTIKDAVTVTFSFRATRSK